MSARGITIVGASAGSGKTHRLTELVTRAIDPRGDQPIDVERVVAVTYTRKAHAELEARIHRSLVAGAAFDQASRLPLAYIGTVHSVCLRLVKELAIEGAFSPNIDVLAEDAAALLREVLEASLPPTDRERLEHLADRFKLGYLPQVRRYDWLLPVSDIMDLARGNRVPAEALAAMATRSASGLLALLPGPEIDGDAIDRDLLREILTARDALSATGDSTRATRSVIDLVDFAAVRLRDQELDWTDWARLANVEPSVKARPLVAKLREVARRSLAHPRFQGELRELVSALFAAASVGLGAYQSWKSRRRVVDYIDMLDRALELLEVPEVQRELRGRLALIVVDEFQDTSPIQLALFMKLHAIAGRSAWVGDRKQCIFEYAGADPLLMDAVARLVASSGGHRETLEHNYRSRPELVEACSALFSRALLRHGFDRSEVEVTARRDAPASLEALPPMGVWALEARNNDAHAAALAEGVRRMLASPLATPIEDRATRDVRGVRPGDIAVLVATNAEAQALAVALHAIGVRAAFARAGLLATPEGVLVDSALRWLLDARDSLSAAKIDVLLGYEGASPDAWLERQLAAAEGSRDATSAWRVSLQPVRDQLRVLAPSEALDAVLAALDVVHLCARWPDAPQRVANLEALRGLAARYEERAAQEHEAGTVAGLLRYFVRASAEKWQRNELVASDDQHVPTDAGAVVISTYHRAKGLEWPVVILSSLDRAERRDAFQVCPESDAAELDAADPLAGRWIRCWPWPFGLVQRSPLAAWAAASDEGRRVEAREEKERARLLYVGFTRARDHLVLAARLKSRGVACQWLDALADEDGEPLLSLPVDAADGAVDVVRIRASIGHEVPARVWRLVGAPAGAAAPAERRWFTRAPEPATFEPYSMSPSDKAADRRDLPERRVGRIVRLPGALTLEGGANADDSVVGDAVHAFFACDVEGLRPDERATRARRLIDAFALFEHLRADALLDASDRLRAFILSRWPDAIWQREVPVEGYVGRWDEERRVMGVIDLLLELPDRFVIIDHKTFPGLAEGAWRAKCPTFGPQLAAYADLVGSSDPARVVETWIHLPIGGAMVEMVASGRLGR